MTDRIRQLIVPVKAHLSGNTGENADFPDLTDGEWDEIYRLSCSHGVSGFAYEGITALGLPLPEKLNAKWQNRTVESILYYYSLQKELFRVITHMQGEGIKPVLLKGFTVSALYPKPELRVMDDIDILVREKFFAAALCLEELGYGAVKPVAVHHVQFKYAKYMLEMHRRPHTPLGYRKYDRNLKRLNSFGGGFPHLTVNGVSVRVLSERDRICHSMLHILKHYYHEGIKLKNLCDLYMILGKAAADREGWQELRSLVRSCGMDRMLSGMVTVLVNEFGMEPETTGDIPLLGRKEAEAFAGDLFSDRTARERVNEYYSRIGFGNTVYMLFSYLGSVRRDVRIKYPYARKVSLLYPAAFVHAYLDYAGELLEKIKRRKGTVEPNAGNDG